jgi:DNA-binding transcriptional LysR family regulator
VGLKPDDPNVASVMHSRHRHDIPIKALRAFIAIIEYGTYSRAADELNLSQPAISAHIKRLQQIMGGHLFEKKPVGLGLTKLGSQVERYARRIVALNDQAIATTGRSPYRETIHLGLQSVFARSVLPDVVRLCRTTDKLSYKYFGDSAPVLAEKLKSGYIDLVLMVASTDSLLNVVAEWTEQLVWVRAPHTFPMTDGEPIPFVGRNDGFIDRTVLGVLDKCERPYRMGYNASEMVTMIAAVESGLGFMSTPERCVPQSLIASRERILPSLPEVRVGVFFKDGFDIARHRSFVTAFVSAVQPPSAKLVILPSKTLTRAKMAAQRVD